MDSHLDKSNILNSNKFHSDNLKLDQQAIRLNDNDMQTIQRRSSSNSGESDVDSGIVAIEHNLSKISSGQLPIKCDLNNYQETNFENKQQFNNVQNQFVQHYINQQNSQFNQDYQTNQLIVQTNQLNQINKIDYQLQNQQTYLNKINTFNELESEKLRNSCKEFLPKLISSKPILNDVIYANLNTVSSNPNLRTFNTFGTLKRINTFSQSQKPLISINSISDSKLIQNSNNLNFIESNYCTQLNDNQYAVPASINCNCLNCEQNKINKLNYLNQQQEISSISLNQQILINQSNDKQLTERERKNNQEDIKRLLIETLRQKNLEKEQLELKERQLQMYLQEREKFIKEREKEKSISDELNKINLNDDLDGNMNNLNNNLTNLNKNVQYENTISILKEKSTSNLQTVNDNLQKQSSTTTSQLPQQQTYQNVPFYQLNNNHSINNENNTKLNEFTKSCFISRPINEQKQSIDDELITKSFNGGYCSKETRKVLEGFGNNLNKKVETRSFLQKFSFKFTKAFTKAFYTSANSTNNDTNNDTNNEHKIDTTNQIEQKEIRNEKSSTLILNQINKNETKQNAIDLDSKLIKENSINKIKQSNFIEKIKSIEEKKLANIDTIDSMNIKNKINNNLKDKKYEETKQDKQFKKKNFQINLDEYCIIKKPELTPKKISIDSLKDDEKKRIATIKKRSSVNRKTINNKIVPVNSKFKSNQRHSHKIISSNKNHSKDLNEKQTISDVIAELIEINKDNSQIIELRRESKKHWGFFVARGKVKNVNGVYVSRMRDEDTKNLLSGLIEVGDQILAIDDVNTKDLSILEVNHLMTNRNTIKLHVKPYIKS